MGDEDQRVCAAHGGAHGVHLNGDRGCKWVTRFRIWCGASWTACGWEWHWQVSDAELRAYDRRISAPGVVARGWQPSWAAALEDAARYRRHIIDERTCLTWS